MANALVSSITISGVTYDLKDLYARERLENLSSALYWVGVTTTELTDGATTNPISVGGTDVTVAVGGVAQYSETEFAWDGTEWQLLGQGNLGALAYKTSASGSYTPAGTVTVTEGDDTTTTVNSITAVGTLPSMTVSGETLVFDPGTLPTKGDNTTVVTASGTRTAAFTGTAATVTVS
jgi:hypothetical protein